jgi:hypothetical protein
MDSTMFLTTEGYKPKPSEVGMPYFASFFPSKFVYSLYVGTGFLNQYGDIKK